MRTWIKLAPAVLLLLPFAPAAFGADPEPTTTQTIEKLRAEVEALRRDVKALQADVLNNGLRGARIDEEVREIRKLLQNLDRMASARESISRFGPPPEGTPAITAPTTGTITVRNQYTAHATVFINGLPYQVLAGQERRVLGVPLGPINYQVEVEGFGVVQSLRTETLRPNGRIINIFPRYGG
jgi:hypothetical protein